MQRIQGIPPVDASLTKTSELRPMSGSYETPPQRPVRLFDQVRQKLRLLHHAIRTEEAYVD